MKIEDFWNLVEKTPTCWLWKGRVKAGNQQGYGALSLWGDEFTAHRVSYELSKGPIPKGLHIDHLCKNRLCVNPAHLEAVPCKVNILRGESPPARQARQTHCKRGHPFTEATVKRGTGGSRQCRVCVSIREKEKRGVYYKSKWSEEVL